MRVTMETHARMDPRLGDPQLTAHRARTATHALPTMFVACNRRRPRVWLQCVLRRGNNSTLRWNIHGHLVDPARCLAVAARPRLRASASIVGRLALLARRPSDACGWTRYDMRLYMRSGSCTVAGSHVTTTPVQSQGRQVLVRGLHRFGYSRADLLHRGGWLRQRERRLCPYRAASHCRCGNGVREGAAVLWRRLRPMRYGPMQRPACASPPGGLPDMTPTITVVQRNTTVGSGDVAEKWAPRVRQEWICCASVYRPTTLGLPDCFFGDRSVRSAFCHLRAVATPISSVATGS